MKREVITNNVFKVKNENGESVECTVLFTFSSTETNKDYIVYTDNSKNDLGEINVYANTFDADKIIVMNHGSIVETGNHDSLMAKSGFYADLYNSQFADQIEA